MILLDARLVRRQQVGPVGGNESKVPINKRALGMSIEAPPAGLERIWQKPIVGIKKNEVISSAALESGITRGGKPLVLLRDAMHRRVTSGRFPGIVGGTIVHNNNLNLGIALPKYTLNRVVQEVCLIMTRDNDGYQL